MSIYYHFRCDHERSGFRKLAVNKWICRNIYDYSLELYLLNPLSADPEKWSNTLKQIVGNLPTICLSVFDHFMNLALKGLTFYTRFIATIMVNIRELPSI